MIRQRPRLGPILRTVDTATLVAPATVGAGGT